MPLADEEGLILDAFDLLYAVFESVMLSVAPLLLAMFCCLLLLCDVVSLDLFGELFCCLEEDGSIDDKLRGD